MRPKTITEKDSATGVTCTADWRVISVQPLLNYQIEVEFVDGLRGLVDLSERIKSKKAGVFAALSDTHVFNQVTVQLGVVTWPGEIDLAPDVMHDEIKKQGKWVLPA
jgi:hypothetical protein